MFLTFSGTMYTSDNLTTNILFKLGTNLFFLKKFLFIHFTEITSRQRGMQRERGAGRERGVRDGSGLGPE